MNCKHEDHAWNQKYEVKSKLNGLYYLIKTVFARKVLAF